MLHVPEYFVHGSRTLTDEVHATSQVLHPYTPGAGGGGRRDDPASGIDLPLQAARQGRRLADVDPEAGIPI